MVYASNLFKGAVQYAEPYLRAMEKSQWHSSDGTAVREWRDHFREYANAARRSRSVTGKPNRNAGTLNDTSEHKSQYGRERI